MMVSKLNWPTKNPNMMPRVLTSPQEGGHYETTPFLQSHSGSPFVAFVNGVIYH